MNKKLARNKSGEKFGFGLLIVLLSISVSLFAFISEENKVTGFVVAEENQKIVQIQQPILLEFNDVNSLSTLSAGNYYIDENGVVYWIDDESKPAIAKVTFFEESQKNRRIYIDDEGRIGYVLESISLIENEQ